MYIGALPAESNMQDLIAEYQQYQEATVEDEMEDADMDGRLEIDADYAPPEEQELS
jgi:hypothetical protein